MNINIGHEWIEYSNIAELSGILQFHRVSLGNYVKLGDGVRLGNDVRLGDGVSLVESPFYVCSNLPYIFNGYLDRIQIGCCDYTVDEWESKHEEIADKHGITDTLIIEKYFQLIQFYKNHFMKGAK